MIGSLLVHKCRCVINLERERATQHYVHNMQSNSFMHVYTFGGIGRMLTSMLSFPWNMEETFSISFSRSDRKDTSQTDPMTLNFDFSHSCRHLFKLCFVPGTRVHCRPQARLVLRLWHANAPWKKYSCHQTELDCLDMA